MSQQYTKLTMQWYSSEVNIESCRHGYSWVKDNSQGDRLFISLLIQTTEDTGRRPYRPNDQYVTSGSCRPKVNEYGPTLLTDREVLTDYICQRSIDLALLLLTLLQGSSIEAVNPIKLCFLCLCQHSSDGNTQPRGCCP